jgi:aminodeoxyfutalosine deaminase
VRTLSADYIFPISSDPIANGLVAIADNGEIMEVLEPSHINYPTDGLEKHSGIICPGFINSHCHLELSYLKGKIPPGNGLPDFLTAVTQLRAAGDEEIQESIRSAEKEMAEAGIVAVGDISNGAHSFAQKAKGNLKYYTFLELIGFSPDKAEAVYNKGLDLLLQYQQMEQENPAFKAKASLVPHAPYTVSGKLLKLIGNQCYADNGIISIHNQENQAENELYTLGTGKFKDFLGSFGIDTAHWRPTGFNSLPSVLAQLPKCNKILLIHNTFTSQKDIDWALNYTKMLYWCFCPKANLYIENRLPNIDLFLEKDLKITIGTDSLSSNDTLSVLEELKTISRHFPHIPLSTQLTWATKNGAELLGFDNLGTIEKGKMPGLNLIKGIDLNKMELLRDSRVVSLTN